MPIAEADPVTGERRKHEVVEFTVYARCLAADVEKDGEVLYRAGDDIGDVAIERLYQAGVDELKVRSVLTCESKVGTPQPSI